MTEEEKMANRLRVGQRIAEIRQQKGYSLRQLSELCGVTYQNLNKIENGKYNVGLDILEKIAKALDMTVDIVERGS
jgi:transcriptional regulator with XRE-family HTH domain